MLWFFGKHQRCWNYSLMQKINYACIQVWCLKAFSLGVPSGTQLKERGLLRHTHLYSERTEISFSKGPYRLSSICHHLLPPQLQFTVLSVGLIEQIVGNLNTSENCLNINATTSWIADTELKICKQLCLSVHKVKLGANFGCPVFDGLNVCIVLGWTAVV